MYQIILLRDRIILYSNTNEWHLASTQSLNYLVLSVFRIFTIRMYHLIILVHIFHSLLLFPDKILGEFYVSVMLMFIYYRLASLTAKKNHRKLEKYSIWVKICNWTNQLNHVSKLLIALSMKISMVPKYYSWKNSLISLKEQWFQQIRQ